MPLFAGSAVPTYHPSLVPRGKAGSPHAPDMGLHPTSPEALDDLLTHLNTDQRTLEVSCSMLVQQTYTLHLAYGHTSDTDIIPKCNIVVSQCICLERQIVSSPCECHAA